MVPVSFCIREKAANNVELKTKPFKIFLSPSSDFADVPIVVYMVGTYIISLNSKR